MGECFFWYWPTRVVPDQRPLNGRCCCCCCCSYGLYLLAYQFWCFPLVSCKSYKAPKFPLKPRGVKGQNDRYIQNWIIFLLLGKELIAPIFDPKYRYHVTFGCPRTQIRPQFMGTGSSFGETFGGEWKTFRGLPSLKIWEGSDKNWERN